MKLQLSIEVKFRFIITFGTYKKRWTVPYPIPATETPRNLLLTDSFHGATLSVDIVPM